MGYDLKLNPKGFDEYTHHSNPFNSSDAKVFFDKLVLRPERDKAWELIKSGKKENEEEGKLILREHGFYQDHLGNHQYNDNWHFLFGRAVEHYVSLVLIEDCTESEAYREAINIIQGYKSPHWRDKVEEQNKIDDLVNNTSCFSNGKKKLTKEDKEIITETEPSFTEFGLTCQFALQGMREVTKGSNRVTGQCKIGGKLKGVDIPYLGYGDFQEGGIEFKTKWGAKPPDRLPENYMAQIAAYWHFTKIQPKLVMSTRFGYKIYSPSIEELENALRAVISACQRREALLYSSSRIDHLLRLTDPKFGSDYQWSGMNPLHLKNARQLWRMD